MLPKAKHHPAQGMVHPYAVTAGSFTFFEQDRFVNTLRRTKLPNRRDPSYADSLKSLHSAILGLCALIESFPYSVEPWMPPLTEGRVVSLWVPPVFS